MQNPYYKFISFKLLSYLFSISPLNYQVLNYPTNLPPLKPGKYILAVAVGCPKNCVGIRIAFEKLDPSQALKQAIKEAKTIEQKVKILAQSGFWYDAQSLLLNSTRNEE